MRIRTDNQKKNEGAEHVESTLSFLEEQETWYADPAKVPTQLKRDIARLRRLFDRKDKAKK